MAHNVHYVKFVAQNWPIPGQSGPAGGIWGTEWARNGSEWDGAGAPLGAIPPRFLCLWGRSSALFGACKSATRREANRPESGFRGVLRGDVEIVLAQDSAHRVQSGVRWCAAWEWAWAESWRGRSLMRPLLRFKVTGATPAKAESMLSAIRTHGHAMGLFGLLSGWSMTYRSDCVRCGATLEVTGGGYRHGWSSSGSALRDSCADVAHTVATARAYVARRDAGAAS